MISEWSCRNLLRLLRKHTIGPEAPQFKGVFETETPMFLPATVRFFFEHRTSYASRAERAAAIRVRLAITPGVSAQRAVHKQQAPPRGKGACHYPHCDRGAYFATKRVFVESSRAS